MLNPVDDEDSCEIASFNACDGGSAVTLEHMKITGKFNQLRSDDELAGVASGKTYKAIARNSNDDNAKPCQPVFDRTPSQEPTRGSLEYGWREGARCFEPSTPINIQVSRTVDELTTGVKKCLNDKAFRARPRAGKEYWEGFLDKVQRVNSIGAPRVRVVWWRTLYEMGRLPRWPDDREHVLDLEELMTIWNNECGTDGCFENHFMYVHFMSHRWERPHFCENCQNGNCDLQGHPDTAENVKARVMGAWGYDRYMDLLDTRPFMPEDAYFWIDYAGINQEDNKEKLAGITALPMYVASCASGMICYVGRDGRYADRAWTALERVLGYGLTASPVIMKLDEGYLAGEPVKNRRKLATLEPQWWELSGDTLHMIIRDPREGQITVKSDLDHITKIAELAAGLEPVDFYGVKQKLNFTRVVRVPVDELSRVMHHVVKRKHNNQTVTYSSSGPEFEEARAIAVQEFSSDEERRCKCGWFVIWRRRRRHPSRRILNPAMLKKRHDSKFRSDETDVTDVTTQTHSVHDINEGSLLHTYLGKPSTIDPADHVEQKAWASAESRDPFVEQVFTPLQSIDPSMATPRDTLQTTPRETPRGQKKRNVKVKAKAKKKGGREERRESTSMVDPLVGQQPDSARTPPGEDVTGYAPSNATPLPEDATRQWPAHEDTPSINAMSIHVAEAVHSASNESSWASLVSDSSPNCLRPPHYVSGGSNIIAGSSSSTSHEPLVQPMKGSGNKSPRAVRNPPITDERHLHAKFESEGQPHAKFESEGQPHAKFESEGPSRIESLSTVHAGVMPSQRSRRRPKNVENPEKRLGDARNVQKKGRQPSVAA